MAVGGWGEGKEEERRKGHINGEEERALQESRQSRSERSRKGAIYIELDGEPEAEEGDGRRKGGGTRWDGKREREGGRDKEREREE